MASNAQEHEPRISEAEIIIGTLFLLIPDVLGAIMVWIGVDDFFVFDIVFGFPLLAYYYSKGLLGTQAAVKNLAKRAAPFLLIQFGGEVAPYLGALPWYTGMFLVVAYLDRHPKLEALVEKASSFSRPKGAAQQAEGVAARESAAVAEQGALVRGAGGAVEEVAGVEGAVSGSGRGQARGGRSRKIEGASAEQDSGFGAGEREEGEGGEKMTLEERRLENAIRGRNIEDLEMDIFEPDVMLEKIGANDLGSKSSEFDPNRAMRPRAANDNSTAANDNSIIDDEQVDLSEAA